MLVPSLGGGKYESMKMEAGMRGTKVNRVSNRKMYRLHCVLKISRPPKFILLAWGEMEF